MKTFWFELLFYEPELGELPGLYMHIGVKGQQRTLPDGERACVGHEALRARELERYVKGLKEELDTIVTEAKRRDSAYHKKLSAHIKKRA